MAKATLEITEERLRAFRATRGMVRGEGAADLVACATQLLGAQAQVDSCALHALAMRTAGRPTLASVKEAILEDRLLVRTWGQRGTLHLYSARDLALVNGPRSTWATSGRRGGMPSESVVDAFEELFRQTEGALTRSDLLDEVPQDYADELADHPSAGKDPRRFAATRLIWMLARRGDIVFGDKIGREQGYVHREHWCPEAGWTEWEADDASRELARRYLAAFGPATWRDVAYHFGAKASDVKRWSATMSEELAVVKCGERELLARIEDLAELEEEPAGEWPVRMLPAYDTMLMGHKDKRIILPDSDEEPLVWKKAAVVAATVIAEGRIVATWSHTKTKKKVTIAVQPLGGWDASLREGVEDEAASVASMFGLELGDVTLGPVT